MQTVIYISIAFFLGILMAIIVSHFGILESPKDPISMKKLIGASIVILGAFISTS